MATYRETIYRARLEWGDGLSIEFTTDRYMDPDAESWHYLTGLDGAVGGVGVEADNPKRGLGHGLFGGPVSRTGRSMTLKADLQFRSQQDRDVADRYVSGILHGVEAGTLTYWVDGLRLSTRVQLDGEVQHTAEGYEWVTLQVPLLAPDPFLYAPARESTMATPGMGAGLKWSGGLLGGGFLRWGGSVPDAVVENAGNAEAWPVYVVEGDFSAGFRIDVNGHSLTYSDPVFRGTPVTIDTGSGQVLVNGQDRTHRLTTRSWEPIPAYGKIVPRLIPLDAYSEGWGTVQWSDTYI